MFLFAKTFKDKVIKNLMKVLYFSKGLLNPSGGAQFAAYNLLRSLLSKKLDITIITDKIKINNKILHEYKKNKIKIITYNPRLKIPVFNFIYENIIIRRKINKLIKLEDYDIVHVHSYGGFSFKIKQSQKTNILITFHDLPSFSYKNTIVPGIFGFIDTLWSNVCRWYRLKNLDKTYFYHAMSKKIKTDLTRYGIKKENIYFLPNGIQQLPKPTISKKEFEKKYNIMKNEIVTFSVGALSYRKAQHETLKALSISNNIRIKFFIIGSKAYCVGAYYKKCLEKLIRTEKLNAVILGRVDFEDLIAFYKYGDYYISSSYSEACQLALLEAKYYVTPFISSDVGCARYFKEKTDFLFDPKKPNELVKIFNKLAKTKQKKKKCKVFLWKEIGEKMYDKYKSIIKGTSSFK